MNMPDTNRPTAEKTLSTSRGLSAGSSDANRFLDPADKPRDVEACKNPFFSQQFLIFLLTGGTAAGVNFTSRYIYNQWTNFSNAILWAYLTGMVVAFVLNKQFVFQESRQSLQKSIFFFTLVNGIAVLQTWAISMTLKQYLLPLLGILVFSDEIAHGIGIVVPVFTSYIGHKKLSFKKL